MMCYDGPGKRQEADSHATNLFKPNKSKAKTTKQKSRETVQRHLTENKQTTTYKHSMANRHRLKHGAIYSVK